MSISLRKLFQQDKGHHGHRGRPGLRGGSQKGIGVKVPYSQDVLEIEHANYLATVEEEGRVQYSLGALLDKTGETNMTQWVSNDFPTWVKKHPYQVHNYKLSILESDPSISYSEIPDILAAQWGKGLIAQDELSSEILEMRISKRKK